MVNQRKRLHRLVGTVFGLILLAMVGAPFAMATGLTGQRPTAPLGDADFHDYDEALAEIGRLLFYDPILSGNRNISCGTCHHHDLASGDGLALGVGEGGEGIGPKRTTGRGAARIEKRVPRNASPLFNLGVREIRVLFHDGRLSVDDIFGNGFNSPAEEYLPSGLKGILAAQALFPLTSETEMAGNPEENKVAGAAYDRIDYVWPLLVERVRGIPDYLDRFRRTDPEIRTAGDLTITHIANAIGDFINAEWRVTDSAFDRYLGGDRHALPDAARAGMELFYGKAGCAECHAGPLMSDQDFHALALPHFGPGRTRRLRSLCARCRADGGNQPIGGRLPVPHTDVAQCCADGTLGPQRRVCHARGDRSPSSQSVVVVSGLGTGYGKPAPGRPVCRH
jgi:cytochrome c peroxidase